MEWRNWINLWFLGFKYFKWTMKTLDCSLRYIFWCANFEEIKTFLWVLMRFSSSLCLWLFKISQARVIFLVFFLIRNISKVLISDDASFSVVLDTKNEKWQMGLKLLNFHLSRNYLAETYLFLPFSSLLSVYDLPNLMWLLRFCLSLLGWFYSLERKKGSS